MLASIQVREVMWRLLKEPNSLTRSMHVAGRKKIANIKVQRKVTMPTASEGFRAIVIFGLILYRLYACSYFRRC